MNMVTAGSLIGELFDLTFVCFQNRSMGLPWANCLLFCQTVLSYCGSCRLAWSTIVISLADPGKDLA